MADVRSFSAQTWPQDPSRRVRLEQWYRTHLKSAQETISNVISSHFCSTIKTKIQKPSMTATSAIVARRRWRRRPQENVTSKLPRFIQACMVRTRSRSSIFARDTSTLLSCTAQAQHWKHIRQKRGTDAIGANRMPRMNRAILKACERRVHPGPVDESEPRCPASAADSVRS